MQIKKHQDQELLLEAIPIDKKKGFLPMLVVMLGFAFFSASILSGGKLGTSLKIQDFIIAILVGNMTLCVYTGLLAYMAADTGLSTRLLAHYSFGEKGSYLVSFLLGATQVGWFGVGIAMFAVLVQKETGIPVSLLVAISGLLMTTTAYFGMKSLTLLSIIAVSAIAILGSMSVGIAVDNMGGISRLLEIVPGESMGAVIVVCVASFISVGTLTPDFIRFLKNKKVALTTNNNTFYASGLGSTSIIKIPRNKLVIAKGIIGTLLALTLYNNFMGWLGLLNILIPSIGGVIIADYFILRKRKYMPMENTVFTSVNKIAVLAWALGAAAAYFLPGIAPINSVVIAVIAYVSLTKVSKMMRTEIGMQNSL